MSKKTIILIISAVIVAVLAAVIAIGSMFGVKNAEQNEGEKVEEVQKGEETAENEKEYTPTFVYFISNDYVETTKDVLDKLQKEYKDKVLFDIRNIDETGEDLSESFGNESVPVLLMHDKKGDICAIQLMATDYQVLKDSIETAIN